MKTFSERLNLAMEEAGISQGQLADLVGLTQPAIQKMTSGKTNGSRKLVELAGALGLRPEWLSSGDGPMRLDGQEPIKFEAASKERIYRVDVLDLKVSAGPGRYMLSDVVEVLHAIEFTSEHARSLFGNRSANDVKVMTVDGDSMAPTVNSGDRLFFDVSVRDFRTDGVYAFVYGKTFHVKRLQMQGEKLAVLSDNPTYEKWYVNDSTQDQFYVMGKALIHESLKYNKL